MSRYAILQTVILSTGVLNQTCIFSLRQREHDLQLYACPLSKARIFCRVLYCTCIYHNFSVRDFEDCDTINWFRFLLSLNENNQSNLYLSIETSGSSPGALCLPFVLKARISCHDLLCTYNHHNVSVPDSAGCLLGKGIWSLLSFSAHFVHFLQGIRLAL